MTTYVPRRRRTSASTNIAATNATKRYFSFSGILIIVFIAIGGSLASNTWLQHEQQKIDAETTSIVARTNEITAEYEALVRRVTADNEYRAYALAASADSIANGTLPSDPSITLYSEHRDPSKIDVVVDKQHPIYPLTFVPETTTIYCNGSAATVIPETAEALTQLCNAATAAGLQLRVTSSYRSYQDQMATYAYWVATDSLAAAETYSARPGYSEHQTGTTIDFAVVNGPVLSDFCGSSEQLWLAQHAHRYGFIQRYTADNERVTGFSAECWHFRYVGLEVARQYTETNARSLEDFWGIRGGSYTDVFRG